VVVPRGLFGSDDGNPPPDQRIHVWPAAGLAVTIPPAVGAAGGADKQILDVRRVDVRKLLDQRQDSFLVFGSEPQLWAVRGKEWRYRPAVWTNDDPAPTPKLQDPPVGMTFQGADLVWTPGGNESTADVRIRVTSGELVAEQRFRLTIVDDHGAE
jgi:hypothetical protein